MRGRGLTIRTMQKMVCFPRLVWSFVLTVCFLSVDASLCNAASQPDGAALHRKHCLACHPEGTLKLSGDLLDSIRIPPPGMPAFSEEKLSDAGVAALGEYLRRAGGKSAQPSSLPDKPQSATSGTAPAARALVSAGLGTGPHTKTNRPWNSGFAGGWTVKGRQNDEIVTVQQFVISSNAHGDPECVVTNQPSDRSIAITGFEITDKSFKLELTWSWKLNSQYWKIETFDLRLSDSGRKLNGTHAVRTSGGHSSDSIVWAE